VLSRWSRLKTAANKGEPITTPSEGATEPIAALEGEQVLAPEDNVGDKKLAVELPKISELTPESDFTPFMQSGVDSVDRNAALKKLFTDPHYNQMDGLDIYIDDYGKPDPIPAEMLKRLMASKFLGLFEEQPELEEPEEPDKPRIEDEIGVENQTLVSDETTRENPSSSLFSDVSAIDAPKERDFLNKKESN
jgi:Protein of unknown function (DUF3306)